MNKTCYVSTPLGTLALTYDTARAAYVSIHYVDTVPPTETPDIAFLPLLAELQKYWTGQEPAWHTLPLAPQGTPFQQRVWQALQAIPYGSTKSYQDIADAIGSPAATRAIGQAVGRNPLLLVIPCHRVIRSDGTLGGFSEGVSRKEALLRLEGAWPLPDIR